MAADEEEAEDIVAVMRIVDFLGKPYLGVAEIGYDLVGGKRVVLPAPAHFIERGVAPDHDEPGGGIAGRTVERPVLQRAQTGFLERLLGLVEIAERAQQRADRLGTRGRQRGVDPGYIGHDKPLGFAPGSK